MQRERMDFDVLIVGAGPAGLAAAIRLGQLNQQHQTQYSIAVIEKGSEVGAHILSGAVLEPRALNELLPNWQELNAPITTPVTEESMLFLTEHRAFPLPVPPPMHNHGNYIVSLANVCRWLAEQATALDISIFPGFAGAQMMYDEHGHVQGVITGDMGIGKEGQHTAHYQPGLALHAKQTIIAEGCRGSLAQTLIKHFDLAKHSDPQTYGIGIKELWKIPAEQHVPGKVVHTVGWPLNQKTYGGSFIYHMENQQIAIGFVIGLDYENPYLDPYQEFQRFKTHPAIRPLLEQGERICYGARALNEGGFQSIPELSFPGGMIVGCSAGFMNVPKIKGSHTAIKSGMVAAETTFHALQHQITGDLKYGDALKKTWVFDELYQVRNIRPAFQKGLLPGLFYAGLDTFLFRGRTPWTFKNHADYSQLKFADQCTPIPYPKPDGKITFDRLSSVYLSNTNHEENQPCHLTLKDPSVAININYEKYASPETRYCPAGVYEIVMDAQQHPKFVINAQNCVHCKTCDIKDPTQNIVWVPAEGGGGPNYPDM